METIEQRNRAYRRKPEEIAQQERRRSWLLPGLRRVRIAKNLQQKELSRLTDVARPNLSRLENGKQRAFWRTVRKLAKVLDCTPYELIEDPEEKDEDTE
jgi:DNA-binding Xre family transcriptional regulator